MDDLHGARGDDVERPPRLSDLEEVVTLGERLDLSGIRFDEDDEALAAGPTVDGTARGADGALSLQDAQRALARGAGAANEIEEITEFEEQFLEPEDISDAKRAAKDEPPELLDLDEAELDNELLLFDDLLKGDAPEAATPSSTPFAPRAAPGISSATTPSGTLRPGLPETRASTASLPGPRRWPARCGRHPRSMPTASSSVW